MLAARAIPETPMPASLTDRLPPGFAAFLVIGGVGFVVDASILATLVHLYGWGDYTARLISFPVAVLVTWLLNRNFAFASGATERKGTEYTRYVGVQTVGSLINFAVYSVCIATIPVMDRWPVIALSVGVMVQIPFNYLGMQKFVFTGNNDRRN
jgi:putative flippase GtrA